MIYELELGLEPTKIMSKVTFYAMKKAPNKQWSRKQTENWIGNQTVCKQ